MLRLVRNAAELESALKAGVRAAPSNDVLTASVATASPGRFSGTYTAEARVDELDAVRYDGSLMFVAPQRVLNCCFIDPLASGGPSEPPPTSRAIRILRTDPSNATARQVGAIALENNVSVQGLYLAGTRAIALTSEAYFGSYGQFWNALPFWAPSRFGLRIYDVVDPSAPRQVFTATMDGVFVDSRRIGDNVYLVSRYVPRQLLDVATRSAAESAPLASLLPQITIDGVSRPLVDPARCYITSDDSDAASAVITSITVVPVSNPSAFATTCYNEDAYGVYVSEQSLYLTQYRALAGPPSQSTSTQKTRIHKFDLATGGAPTYRGSAEIDGAVWTGGQADFLNDASDNVDHYLYLLRQKANLPELELISRLPNSQRPEEIGKPNEQLYGVRFLGNRAYAVTFRRIDPLYVLDLSNQADPRIAGSLDLPGFSDFLHPVNENLLLGLGQAQAGGVRLALFDVSTLSLPRELGGITLGGRGTSSEAQYDRHAFSYLADVAGVDRFTVPINAFSEDGQFRFQESALHLFEIRGKSTPSIASITDVGKIVARTNTATPAVRSRAFIHNNAVFYTADDEVRGAMWTTPSLPNGPF
jgi:uncharacterized secreted protein with C-terminal beta-propeller domain